MSAAAALFFGHLAPAGRAQGIGLGLGIDELHPVGVTGTPPAGCTTFATDFTNTCNLIVTITAGPGR